MMNVLGSASEGSHDALLVLCDDAVRAPPEAELGGCVEEVPEDGVGRVGSGDGMAIGRGSVRESLLGLDDRMAEVVDEAVDARDCLVDPVWAGTGGGPMSSAS